MLTSGNVWLARLALPVLAVALAGCGGSDPADSLGVFAVAGTLSQQCSADGLLAVPERTEFLVELKRLGTSLHWLEADRRLVGTLDTDASFRFNTYLRVDMRQDTPDAELPPCVIERYDEKVGTLELTSSDTCSGFSGQLRFYVVPLATSDCSDLLEGDDAIADELPCTVTYDVTAAPYVDP